MPKAGGGKQPEVTVELDRGDLQRFGKEVRGFGDALERESRRGLRAALEGTVTEMRQRVESGPGRQDVGLRRGIAAGIRVTQIAGGLRLEATGDALPQARQVMVAAYDAESFRHPVFGRRATSEVTQSGRPYFGYTVDRRRRVIERSQEQALHDAAATVHTGKVTDA